MPSNEGSNGGLNSEVINFEDDLPFSQRAKNMVPKEPANLMSRTEIK